MASIMPGRTAPRLLLDILSFDTSKGAPITPPPSPLQDGRTNAGFPPERCQHSWMIKAEQSTTPELDQRAENGVVFKVACYCCHCRCHLDVTIEYGRDSTKQSPCPNHDYPLHHFIHHPEEVRDPPTTTSTQNDEVQAHLVRDVTHRWTCTSPQCSAVVTLRIRPPRLSSSHLDLLIDPVKLQNRLDVALNNEPDRFEGIATARPTTALNHLRIYITDALKPAPGKTQFSDRNKQFAVSLGEDSAPLLKELGFTHELGFWHLPRFATTADYSENDPLRLLVDDVKHELVSLVYQYPAQERQGLILQVGERPARGELERILGTLDYKKSLSSRTHNLVDDQDRPYYVELGAVFDFEDSLVSFTYDRQVTHDHVNAPNYFECLQDVARERNSEELAMKVAMLESEGQISRKDVLSAYKYFGLDGAQAAQLIDQDIIRAYQYRLSTTPSRREHETRNALRILGVARGSEALQEAARNAIETYAQALSWLGVTADTSDDFVASMYTMKVSENDTQHEIAHRAVEIIANARDSDILRGFLQTGSSTESYMTLARAYELYGIPSGTTPSDIDPDGLILQHASNIIEHPSRRQELDDALEVIAQHHPRNDLKNYANGLHGTRDSTDTSELPLGLENLGNTCYLNSLLQYLFVIRPLRELVLNFDQHKIDLTASDCLKGKKVGSSDVNFAAAIRGQKFVARLGELVRSMIEAPASSDKVRPEIELARLALVKSPLEPTRRRSTISGSRPEVAATQERIPDAYTVETAEPALAAVREEGDVNSSSDSTAVSGEDTMSDATLIEDRSSEKLQPQDRSMHDVSDFELVEQPHEGVLDEAEEMRRGSSNAMMSSEVSASADMRPPMTGQGLDSSPTSLHDTTKDAAMSADTATAPQDEIPPSQPGSGPAPLRAPPIPPRPKNNPKASIPTEEEDLSQVARQQDVSEVLESVINKMRSAIISRGRDEDGEQIDDVRSLFYGKSKLFTTQPDRSSTSIIEEIFADIQVSPLEAGACDVYAALDKEHDPAHLADGSVQYRTISVAPQLLQLHIRRGQWDKAKGKAYKNNEFIKPENLLYLDRYLDSDDRELLDRRSEKWSATAELAKLEQRRQTLLHLPELDGAPSASIQEDVGSVPELLDVTAKYLESLSKLSSEDDSADDDPLVVDVHVIDAIRRKADTIRAEVNAIDTRTAELNQRLSSLFADFRAAAYRLEAVFMHRGEAGHGHYWILLYDAKRDTWRKYNDERVEEGADTDEISVEGAANSATAYYLVYVRDDGIGELIDCVCRRPPPPRSPPVPAEEVSQQDVRMGGYVSGDDGGRMEMEMGEGDEAATAEITPPSGEWDSTEVSYPNVRW